MPEVWTFVIIEDANYLGTKSIMATSDDRKKRIMEHLARSTGKFTQSSPQNTSQRSQQILDHVKRTKG